MKDNWERLYLKWNIARVGLMRFDTVRFMTWVPNYIRVGYRRS